MTAHSNTNFHTENASIKVALFEGAFPLLLSVLKLKETADYIKLAKHALGIFAAICSTRTFKLIIMRI